MNGVGQLLEQTGEVEDYTPRVLPSTSVLFADR